MNNITMTISSSAFQNEGDIPSKYTCEGEDINPAIQIEGVPDQAESLVLILEDPDAPNGTFTHWLVWDISPSIGKIEENSDPGLMGENDFGKIAYGGPCPPSKKHRYYFRFYALDTTLKLPAGTKKEMLQDAMKPHVIAEGTLMGRYEKKNK